MLSGTKLARRALSGCAVLVCVIAACGDKSSPPKGKLDGLARTAVDTVPADTAFMLGLSWGRLKESKVYPKIATALGKEKEIAKRLAALDAACGIDPLRELDSVVAVNNAEMQEKTAILFVKGNWDAARAAECLDGYWRAEYFNALTASPDGELTAYTIGETGQKIYAAWIAADTVVFAPKNPRKREFIADVVGKKSSVKDGKAFMDLLASVDTTKTFWMAMSAESNPAFEEAFAQLVAGASGKPLGLYVTVDLVDGLDATFGFRFTHEKDAREVTRKAKLELKAYRTDEAWSDFHKYMQDIEVTTRGADVVIRARLSEAYLEELVTAFEEYLPQLGKLVRQNLTGG
jgi:hypothetical protein